MYDRSVDRKRRRMYALAKLILLKRHQQMKRHLPYKDYDNRFHSFLQGL